MKKRIKEMATEAGFDFDPNDCNFYVPEGAGWINKEIYEFADLIIHRCISQVALMAISNEESEDIQFACDRIIENIKKDFE